MSHYTTQHQPYSIREIRRLAETPLRRPLVVLAPFLLCLAAALVLAALATPRYSSSTLILVAPERLPDGFVPKVDTEQVSRRLQTLRQEVGSRTRLETVARELDPYGTLGREPLIDTIERMRNATTLAVKGSDAFTIEFEHSDPKMAMLVAARLATLFMDEVVGTRARQVAEAYQFIDAQLTRARAALEEKEKALAAYKLQHMGTLPEQVESNLSTLNRLQVEHQTVADSLRKATDTLRFLETAATRAASLPAPPPDSVQALRAQLEMLLGRYTLDHPDVRAVQARLAALEARGQAEGGTPVGTSAPSPQDELRDAREEVLALRLRLADIEGRIGQFQARVESAPRREQEILALTRDYKDLSENYSHLLSKKFDADLAASLERYSKGQQFRIIDPANLPERPSYPNWGLFAIWGALAGVALGVGLAMGLEVLDPSIKDVDDLGSVLAFPVLAVMPHVRPRDQRAFAAPEIGTPPPAEAAVAMRGAVEAPAAVRRVGGGDDAR